MIHLLLMREFLSFAARNNARAGALTSFIGALSPGPGAAAIYPQRASDRPSQLFGPEARVFTQGRSCGRHGIVSGARRIHATRLRGSLFIWLMTKTRCRDSKHCGNNLCVCLCVCGSAWPSPAQLHAARI